MTNIYDRLENLVSEIKSQCTVDSFLSGGQENAISEILRNTKDLYNTGRFVHPTVTHCMALPSLLVDGFDMEQVWQQLEVGCNGNLNSLSQSLQLIIKQSDASENEPMAKDFFDDGESAGDDERDNDEEEEEDRSDEEETDMTNMNKEEKSSFEKRLQKIKAKVNELEEENLNEKPWQMKGEVLASARPQNSLLSELVDFEHIARQPPMITEEATQTEENFIIQRIKDRAWDDVQRKIKPADLGQEYRKRIVLNQEKSQLGLADVYAAAYRKEAESLAVSGQETGAKEDHKDKEIRQSVELLFIKLDALSNFHYTPKPVMRDIDIVVNEPSISVEDVAPTFLSEAATLAPEEVQGKTKGQLLGDGEKTSTDKRRERRRKKRRQQIKKIAKEEKEKLKSALGMGVTSKVQAMGEVGKKSKMDKGITIVKGTKTNEQKKMKNSNKSLSSTKFFNQLQQDAVDTIKQKTVQKPKETNSISAKRIKL